MERRFYQLTLDDFDKLLRRFEFKRRILSVHLHHTWRPNRNQFNGENSLQSMWRYHTGKNHLNDIAAHLLIAPDGTVWTGRGWDSPPASARGNNGTSSAGPFMIAMVGDFDRGHDRLDGEQRSTTVGVIARLQLKAGLALESLIFHGDLAAGTKSCPGDSIDRQELIEEIRAERNRLSQQQTVAAASWAAQSSEYRDPLIGQLLGEWALAGQAAGVSEDGEPDEAEMTPRQERIVIGLEGTTARAPGARSGDDDLTPEMLAELRPHVINLNQGKFSQEGLFRSTQADVDAIFEDHLERALAVVEANPDKGPLRLLFWAHGGLISEKAGLIIAHLQVNWWKQNGVYPIHFVWETGFCDALKQIFSGAREAVAARELRRDIWDHTTDPGIEALARAMGGVKIWGAMKESARLASEPDGGADYAARKLAEFCARHPGKVELYAVGHSAGSIFHAHFLPAAFKKGVPPFELLSFLAPAVRVDEFKKRLVPELGAKNIKKLAMFTMKRDWEQSDNVAKIYHKSLLYLIYWALEPEREEPIVGLEVSARGDADLAALFGLKGVPSEVAEVVWSKTLTSTGRSASTSASHGGFDNDRPTMNSVLRRVVRHDDIVDFPDEAVGRGLGNLWDKPPELPPEFTRMFSAVQAAAPPCGPATAPGNAPTQGPATAGGQAQPVPAPTGAKTALCIGINKYPAAPLNGCVSDARSWGAFFQGNGYQVTYLLDEEATREGILGSLERLITGSKAGDRVLFQYSGHGTELDDIDGDEAGQGTNGPKDEALCPFDYADGAFVIDDDIADVFAKIPDQVSVDCFIDCCHSGTITRFMIGATMGVGANLLPRFIAATPEMAERHRLFRQKTGRRGIHPGRRPENMRQVVFSACLDSEVAYESNGQGEFTVRALQVLRQGVTGFSNEGLMKAIVAAFGPSPRQHPELDCAPVARPLPFVI